MRDFIISEIRRLAGESAGSPPGKYAFARATGITEGKWRGVLWLKWGDALKDAGFAPNQFKREKLNAEQLIEDLALLTRRVQRLPTRAEIKMEGRQAPNFPSGSAVDKYFPKKENLAEALRSLGERDERFADILPLLPPAEPIASSVSTKRKPDGFVYLLKSGKHYKIGRSEDIERRFREVKIALPEAVTLIHTIRTDDPSGIESYWHRRFAERRANGEWFALDGEDVRSFCRRTFQ